jgi:hypothetical protein
LPVDSGKQFVGSDFKGAGQLDEGVDPRHPKAALKLTDLGAMD